MSYGRLRGETPFFSRGLASMMHFERTYGGAKCEIQRLLFMDCVLMFGKDRYLADDNAVRSPRLCRPCQVFDFDLIGGYKSEEDVNSAKERLLKFFSATWRGNLGAHHAEMMWQALEYAGREVGRFFIPPDKNASGGTTRDLAFCHFIGSAESSGNSSMSGALRADWLFGDRQLGFEGHRILRCKFTFTQEMGDKPLLNDAYKRFPANVTPNLRKPRIDQVHDGPFGMCLYFSATNSAPEFVQKGDDVQPITKRAVCTVSPNKRRFARSPGEVD